VEEKKSEKTKEIDDDEESCGSVNMIYYEKEEISKTLANQEKDAFLELHMTRDECLASNIELEITTKIDFK
jgi:hypothetical protein